VDVSLFPPLAPPTGKGAEKDAIMALGDEPIPVRGRKEAPPLGGTLAVP